MGGAKPRSGFGIPSHRSSDLTTEDRLLRLRFDEELREWKVSVSKKTQVARGSVVLLNADDRDGHKAERHQHKREENPRGYRKTTHDSYGVRPKACST